ncbi:MAG TPA: GDCCVxC domain-containing (seleno)protein [Ignavibacteria bacterium]|nr:GDCCVxC domain-containing (seleno)protein [Ignavibacteria bacterium]HMQ97511.1 GDCCVxC domain-containing (seleno)protein [Ignavibacteria bacterium]
MNKNIYSVITCPYCLSSKEEILPENSCLHFYECENCHTLLKPNNDDCCVFCSFGSIKCPPMQKKIENG